MSRKIRERIQWQLLTIFLITDLTSFFLNMWLSLWRISPLFFLIPDVFLVLMLLLNALEELGKAGFFLFFFWSALLAFVAESYAIHYQPFGTYEFNLTSSLSVGPIPVYVLLSWPFFIYVGFVVTNNFWLWRNKELPDRYNKNLKSMLLMVIMDAYLVTAMDLIIDPIQRYEKLWEWPEGGAFYGVPVGNFIGWFAVTAGSTIVYRFYRYFYPRQRNESATRLIPVFIYLLIAGFYMYSAYKLEGSDLALIGALAMLPVPVLCLWFWMINKMRFLKKLKKKP